MEQGIGTERPVGPTKITGPYLSHALRQRGTMMRNKGYTIRKRVRPKREGGKSVDEIVRELQETLSPRSDYREQSLRIHGLICAKCAREFDYKDRHLLTVHHKDGNSRNNPPDGSNWENLCVYCHEEEHSRGLLGDYLSEGKEI